MKPVWAWFGYDEPDYTYIKEGKKLLSEIAALSAVPVYVRAHNLMTTGDGTPALKFTNTNELRVTPIKISLPDELFHQRITKKLAELIYQWVRHSVDRYGQTEVESWYWVLWNEPNSDYLMAPDRLKT